MHDSELKNFFKSNIKKCVSYFFQIFNVKKYLRQSLRYYNVDNNTYYYCIT